MKTKKAIYIPVYEICNQQITKAVAIFIQNQLKNK